ncbi:hypothetical protein GF336_03135 [Candidatus Woesearchaeota archaeon]|nr:hypothetical protein [Candidatus Woesearchaeota archaeon]
MEYEIYNLMIIESDSKTMQEAKDYLYIPGKGLAYDSDKNKVDDNTLNHIRECFENENMHSVISERKLDEETLEKLITSLG